VVILPRIFLLLLLPSMTVAAAPKNRDEVVFLFQNRKVMVAVPEGFGFQSAKDARGIISVRLAHPQDKISLQVSFLPDPEGRLGTARGRKEFIYETFQDYVASSVEKAMRFEELEPRAGGGTYCVFTDAALVGKASLPRGEFLQTTTGIKSWPGVVAVFTLFSNETASKEYRAMLEMLRDSLEEVLAAPKP
jgi:hypothetical protein